MVRVKLQNEDKDGHTKGISIILPDGRNLLEVIPIRAIEFRQEAGALPELRLELDDIGVKHDLLCTMDVEEIVRDLRELEQEKYREENKKL